MQIAPIVALFAGILAATVSSGAGAQALTQPMIVNVGLGSKPLGAAFDMTMTGVGSGVNGPQTAQYGVNLSATKNNGLNTTVVGEVASVNVNLSQGGPSSDGRGLVITEEDTGLGFSNGAEMVASYLNPSNYSLLPLFVDVQLATASAGGNLGAVFGTVNGTGTAGILVNTSANATWNNILQASKNGKTFFTITNAGSILTTGKVTVASLITSGSVETAVTPLTQISVSHVLQRENCGTTLRSLAGEISTLLVPKGLPVGCHVEIIQAGLGALTFEGRGLTIEHFGSPDAAPLRTTGLNSHAELLVDAEHTVLIRGDVRTAPASGYLSVSDALPDGDYHYPELLWQ